MHALELALRATWRLRFEIELIFSKPELSFPGFEQVEKVQLWC